jgi:phosphopentomutase
VYGVGKIPDIFAGRGITEAVYSTSNDNGVDLTIDYLRRPGPNLVFTNLVDFDSKYGHRNDPAGFAKNLAAVDALLPALLAALRRDDLLFLTADHGCETTDVSTDHTREHVPFLAAGAALAADVDLGVRRGFADLAATAGEWLGVAAPRGESALALLLR